MNSVTLEGAVHVVDTESADDLLLAAAAIAQDAYPGLDPQTDVRTVREWGRKLAARIAADTSPLNRLRMLNHFFFAELGFRGNAGGYYEPDNSYLNRVLERRCGIPISLAVVYIALGRALGLRLAGVAFPGHFLVRLALHDSAVFIDVFERGATMSPTDLRERFRATVGDDSGLVLEHCLHAVGDREILTRWLRNLKAIHRRTEDWTRLLKVCDRLVALRPAAAEERRDRSLAYEKLECPRAAADDLAAALALGTGAGDLAVQKDRLQRLRAAAQRLN